MAKILIVYGTTEGQTRKIAEHIAGVLRERGHEVALYDSERRPRNLAVDDFAAVIVAASIHQQEHRESIVTFAQAHRDQLNAVPSLFASVSLSAGFEEGAADAQAYVDQFLADTGWRPGQVLKVAGALKYSEYDYFKQQIIEHLVLKGRSVAEPGSDYELTDWDQLDRDIDDFAGTIPG